MSHMIADSFTLYSIYGMINSCNKINEMNPNRVLDWKKGCISTLGNEQTKKMYWYLISCNKGPFQLIFAK